MIASTLGKADHAYAGDLVDASSQIDAIIELDLQEHELRPNPPADDAPFVRRVYLDVIGRIPTDKELRSCYGGNRKDRRARFAASRTETR
ncbi:MAG: DUF1549 domain-containing protein [Planctomycetota bacterium]